jgi:hypothetical protein
MNPLEDKIQEFIEKGDADVQVQVKVTFDIKIKSK